MKLYINILLVIFSYSYTYSQVGINTSTPLSTLDINGNLNVKEIGIVNPNVSGSAVFNAENPTAYIAELQKA